jgi:hypothetical protein
VARLSRVGTLKCGSKRARADDTGREAVLNPADFKEVSRPQIKELEVHELEIEVDAPLDPEVMERAVVNAANVRQYSALAFISKLVSKSAWHKNKKVLQMTA